jgi:hypothetical protein
LQARGSRPWPFALRDSALGESNVRSQRCQARFAWAQTGGAYFTWAQTGSMYCQLGANGRLVWFDRYIPPVCARIPMHAARLRPQPDTRRLFAPTPGSPPAKKGAHASKACVLDQCCLCGADP